MSDTNLQEKLLPILYKNRRLAHKHLFAHKHKNTTPEFHDDLLDLFYSSHPRVCAEAFRGAAKSTRLEEIITLGAHFKDFNFCILIGNSYERACERLTAIKREIENNEKLIELFGNQKGQPWSEDQIVLSNGVKIQAFGARQSLRGAKHIDERPDLCVIDDLEDEENVQTEEARRKLKRWFNGALLPAMNPKTGRIRMVGTPLHPKALIEEKVKDANWLSKKFPVKYLDELGAWVSTWPDRFPMSHIEFLENSYTQDGNYIEFEQEYMCRSEDAAAKPFQVSMIKVAPALAVWTPIQIFVDPARTTKVKTSARTGYAVWAWTGPRLTVHEAFGAFHKPDEIIKTIFDLDERFRPVEIGVEADGLEEFIMQPLRTEMLKRGVSLPLKPYHAPKNKDDFITGLQPFYMAGEVSHVKNLPDLTSELLQFPSGRKDVPNALAYALKMRVGKVIYPDFMLSHICPEITGVNKNYPVYLCLNSRPSLVTGVLVQFINGALTVYKDWVKQGPPQEVLESIVQEARMFAQKEILYIAPKEQFDKYTNFGLKQACNTLRLKLITGAYAERAEGSLAPWLRKQVQGQPAVIVSDAARWCVNGLSMGYARKLDKNGMLAPQPEENNYAAVIEGFESYVAWFDFVNKSSTENLEDNLRNYAITPDGRRYLSTRAT